jgi:hypothetical protein
MIPSLTRLFSTLLSEKWLDKYCEEVTNYWKRDPKLCFVDSVDGVVAMSREIAQDLWFEQFECK